MIYKIVMSKGDDITLEDDAALMRFLDEANKPGQKLVITKYGVVNISYLVSIVEHREKMEQIRAALTLGKTPEQVQGEICGPSPFAKAIADKMEADKKLLP